MKKITLHDLVLVNEHAKKAIIEFPRGGRLRGMQRALSESEIRTLAFVEGVLAVTGGEALIEIETPDSETAADE